MNIIIEPNRTIIDGEKHEPENIIIVLPNGTALDINAAVAILQKKYKPKKPKTPSRLDRLRRAWASSQEDSSHHDPRPSPWGMGMDRNEDAATR